MISAIMITMIIATVFGVAAIRDIGQKNSEKMLMLLCEAGAKNLDVSLLDVEQDVETISAYVEADLTALDDESLSAHLNRVSDFFKRALYKTNGIITYYYRIDPAVSPNVKGFWFVNENGEGFQEHEVTDITRYDTEDTSQLVWFTVPKATGKSVWLPPYITDNLDARVISYNTPVYLNGRFVGVIGIELDYTFMAEVVNNITLYENGYAFVNDEAGTLVYHPRMDVMTMETPPETPEAFRGSRNTIINYTFDGVKKMAVSLPLVNGDWLNVSVPVNEINAVWQRWVRAIIIAFAVLLILFILFIMRYTRRITKPLQDITKVAEEIDAGNYDHKLDYSGDDEIGILTRTFSRVAQNLKRTITDLNDLAYADAMTSLRNKGAFDIFMNNLQIECNENRENLVFAIVMFDCNSLKAINDQYGHDKGDIYLKETANIICDVFNHSPVFRIGGDEFAALLEDGDYENRDALLNEFDRRCAEKQKQKTDAWEKVSVARGMAVYDPKEDDMVYDVVRRADRLMYENKWNYKATSAGSESSEPR